MIKMVIGAIVGLLLLIVWLVFLPDDEEEIKEHRKWIDENWEEK